MIDRPTLRWSRARALLGAACLSACGAERPAFDAESLSTLDRSVVEALLARYGAGGAHEGTAVQVLLDLADGQPPAQCKAALGRLAREGSSQASRLVALGLASELFPADQARSDEIAQWTWIAAKQGSAASALDLFSMYDQSGVHPHAGLAATWLGRAVHRGSAEARRAMLRAVAEGRIDWYVPAAPRRAAQDVAELDAAEFDAAGLDAEVEDELGPGALRLLRVQRELDSSGISTRDGAWLAERFDVAADGREKATLAWLLALVALADAQHHHVTAKDPLRAAVDLLSYAASHGERRAHVPLAEAYLALGEYADATRHCDLAQRQGDSGTASLSGRIAEAQGDFEDAESEFWVGLYAGEPGSIEGLGRIAQRPGDAEWSAVIRDALRALSESFDPYAARAFVEASVAQWTSVKPGVVDVIEALDLLSMHANARTGDDVQPLWDSLMQRQFDGAVAGVEL